jgi:hypothetical protein
LYIPTLNRLLSQSPSTAFTYQHNKGNYGQFYGTYFPSSIRVITNQSPEQTKVYNNFLLHTEVIAAGIQVNETVNSVQCTNDYQDTGVVPLIVGTDIKRKERKWTMQVPRDSNSSAFTTLKARMRDTHQFTEFKFTNNSNKRFIIHDILTDVMPSIS